jgi:hypothetical protein
MQCAPDVVTPSAERTLLRRLSRLHRLVEPLVESDLADPRAVAGNERVFREFGAEIPCVPVGNHLTRINDVALRPRQ